ncbi:hypothetical protein CYMTET_24413 [Cymbomonas tetramitiformis]|uniref:Uncharacterized protein n=1 Tax=Cymbomonas tetramitiformis TaxID=36881 RepID=A0AAE0KZZ2_9CHLO|nr:hypothetical protein CYMTET_24413 [Cymbomonas tetramitiformis]
MYIHLGRYTEADSLLQRCLQAHSQEAPPRVQPEPESLGRAFSLVALLRKSQARPCACTPFCVTSVPGLCGRCVGGALLNAAMQVQPMSFELELN